MYQVLEAIVHSERACKGEYNVLLLADFSVKKYHDYRELGTFFDEVRLFPYRSISNNPETILEEVENAWQNTVPHEITEFENIYVASAFYYFSLYLIANRIPFHMFEDGGGILSKPKVLYEIIRDVTPVMADIAQTYGLLDGSSEYVLDVICNFSAQSFIADNPKWRNFDPVAEITQLSPETIRKILHFFRLEPIRDIAESAALVFTQQFANLYTTTLEDQIAIYQVCSDFFLSEQPLIFKPHPDDTVNYASFFPESRTIQGRFPAELMPILLDRVPETSFTVSSTSVRNIGSIFKKNIVCGYDFPNTFRTIDHYYFAVRLLSETEELKSCPVHTFGVDVSLLEAIAEHSLKTSLRFVHETSLKKETDGRQVWLIDDCDFVSDYFKTKKKDSSFAYRSVTVKGVEATGSRESDSAQGESAISASETPEQPKDRTDTGSVTGFLETIGEKDVVIFLNSRNDSRFYDEAQKELFLRMIPVSVTKRKTREKVFFPDRDFIIYAYTGDAGIREKINLFHAKILLKNTGLEEEIQKTNPERKEKSVSEALRETVIHAGETRISMEEYLDLAMDLNDMSMKRFLMDKINLFIRPGLRELMHRPALEPASADDVEVRQFLRTWGKITGKRNSSAGEGFRIYTGDGTDTVRRIRNDGADILEPLIRQHQAYQAIYPDSLNTLRIHTVRSSQGVRTFLLPILSVGGDGAVTDISNSTTRYRVLLAEDGSIIQAFRQDPGEPWRPAERHHNTGYLFRRGRKLPGVPECLECCRKAAFYIPEMRYIGWDVTVTENGPVIVEANNISASFYAWQQAKERITGAGVRQDIEEMLAFGMENVCYNERTVWVSEPLVGIGASLPGPGRLYGILLQSALHRHGVEFHDREYIKRRPDERKNCSIRYLEDENAVLLKTELKTERIPQPDMEKSGLSPYGEDEEHPHISEEDFFTMDRIAMREAARIYRALAQDAGQEASL
jgi:hypothetical protein